MSNDTVNDTSDDEKSRSIAKTGVLATSALALGATANAASAQDGQQSQVGLVYAYQFYPDTDFTVLTRLPQETTVQLLQTTDDEVPPELGDLADWRGHVIRYDVGAGGGITTLLFLSEQTMSEGDSSSTGGNAQIYSSELNLLATTLGETSGDGEDGEAAQEGEDDQDGEAAQEGDGGGEGEAENESAEGGQEEQADNESDGLEIDVSAGDEDNESA